MQTECCFLIHSSTLQDETVPTLARSTDRDKLLYVTHTKIDRFRDLTFVCPCIVSIIVNDDHQDTTILAYLFIPNQLYMFRAMYSPIIRSTDCIYSF